MKIRWAGLFYRSRKRKAKWICGGFVLAAVLLLAGWYLRFQQSSDLDGSPALLVASTNFSPGQRGMPWYIHSGQWRADIRSLGALLRYLSEREGTVSTNLPMAGASDA